VLVHSGLLRRAASLPAASTEGKGHNLESDGGHHATRGRDCLL